MGNHLCTGSPWVKSVLTHGRLLITHGQPLILPVGRVPTADWWRCSRPWVFSFHVERELLPVSYRNGVCCGRAE